MFGFIPISFVIYFKLLRLLVHSNLALTWGRWTDHAWSYGYWKLESVEVAQTQPSLLGFFHCLEWQTSNISSNIKVDYTEPTVLWMPINIIKWVNSICMCKFFFTLSFNHKPLYMISLLIFTIVILKIISKIIFIC